MSKRDYYSILGVARNASGDAIKKAYKKLAMKYHPDRNPGDKKAESKFKELSEAYEVLSNADKRNTYDQFGHEGVNSRFGQAGGFSGAGAFNDIFGDVFGDIFGGTGRQRTQRGTDLEYVIDLTLEEAINGKEANIEMTIHEIIVRKKASRIFITFFCCLNEKKSTNPIKKVRILEKKNIFQSEFL